MSEGRLRRGLVAAAAVTGLVALSVAFSAGVAPAAEPDAASTEATVRQLPPGLKEAIQRDLKTDAATYVNDAKSAQKAAATGTALRKELGREFGGVWFDPATKKAHVAVTSEAAAKKARAAGAEAHVRPTTEARLKDALNALSTWVRSLPEAERKLVFSASIDVKGGKLNIVLADSEDGRRVQAKMPKPQVSQDVKYGKLQPKAPANLLNGSGYIGSSGGASPSYGLCSIGFNAVDQNGKLTPLTAGHCALMHTPALKEVFVEVKQGNQSNLGDKIGAFATTVWDNADNGNGQIDERKGNDYATIRVTNPAVRAVPEVYTWGNAGGNVKVDSVSQAIVGMNVCKSGRTTGWTCGKVVNERSLWYIGDGTEKGKAQLGFEFHGACVAGGDSGGAIVAGGAALGWSTGAYFEDGKCIKVPDNNGNLTYQNLGESLATDILTLPEFSGNKLTVLTTTGDADGDGVKDVEELSANPTQTKDANGDGIAAHLDPDEPNLRPATVKTPAADARITETKPTLSGAAKPGAKVSVQLDGKDLGEATGTDKSEWTLKVGSELALGAHEVKVKQTLKGTSSKETTSKFTVVPVAPQITEPKTGATSDNAKPVVAGTGIAKALVTVTVDDKKVGEATVAADGKWSLPLTADLAVGERVIGARQTVEKVDSDVTSVRYIVKGAAPGPQPGNNKPGGGGLADTGVDFVWQLIVGGLVALVAGGALMVKFRRRKA
ncbi:Ig-like domain-containing protein [Allokutzneria sp. A3M-2-11 16]|uniref:LPXTG cell wall anchor domain-containing protein n=1 Tax=Allokutzneria sp. A3M-2-11 16 TaxID=2962043 RepID=UPI0020B865FB|nr:LPXTG cell wall anchor domain-containing protein [Allokutzneria sp. A3M-2-11 16]MCP3799247.1 Ig-like domain-containing protein [Allokutzneria sp. A3M-2-11 16]